MQRIVQINFQEKYKIDFVFGRKNQNNKNTFFVSGRKITTQKYRI